MIRPALNVKGQGQEDGERNRAGVIVRCIAKGEMVDAGDGEKEEGKGGKRTGEVDQEGEKKIKREQHGFPPWLLKDWRV
jgi:hypothetical protein